MAHKEDDLYTHEQDLHQGGDGTTSPERESRDIPPGVSKRQYQQSTEDELPPEYLPVENTRSGRRIRPVQRLMMAMTATTAVLTAAQVPGEILCFEAMYPNHAECDEQTDPLIAYKATSDPDTTYMHQTMDAPDRQQFVDAMKKDVEPDDPDFKSSRYNKC